MMSLRHYIFLVVLMLVYGDVPVHSVDSKSKPDFTGTWLLDEKKSDFRLSNRTDLPITISHRDPEFRITIPYGTKDKVINIEFVFFTDGRGEVYAGAGGSAKAEEGEKKPNSKTEWSGDNIVTEATLSRGNFVKYKQRDEWKLSRDGKVLTQYRRTFDLKPGDIYMNRNPMPDKKMVYNRISETNPKD